MWQCAHRPTARRGLREAAAACAPATGRTSLTHGADELDSQRIRVEDGCRVSGPQSQAVTRPCGTFVSVPDLHRTQGRALERPANTSSLSSTRVSPPVLEEAAPQTWACNSTELLGQCPPAIGVRTTTLQLDGKPHAPPAVYNSLARASRLRAGDLDGDELYAPATSIPGPPAASTCRATALDLRGGALQLQHNHSEPAAHVPPTPLPRVAWDPGPPGPGPDPAHAQCPGPGPQPVLAGSQVWSAQPGLNGASDRSIGSRFRAALRGCSSLDEVEALLERQRPPPWPSEPRGRGGDNDSGGGGIGVSFPVDRLSVPSLCAVVSVLPRLPEARTPGGRRRLRALLSEALVPAVLARRRELDAAAPAILMHALAALGPELLGGDPRDGRSELLEALAEAGLAACRLPPNMSLQSRLHARDQEPKVGSPRRGQRPPPGECGHSPRSYSSLLWGLAKLGCSPDEVWLARYTAASVPWLRGFPPRDLATCAWALAVVGYRPGEAWLRALLAAWPVSRPGAGGAPGPILRDGNARTALGREVMGAVEEGRADAHSLSVLLWALWRLGVAAPDDWLDAALTACASPRHGPFGGTTAASPFPGATCQSVGLIAYSLARMRYTPPPGARAALLQAAQPLLQRGSAQDLVLLLVGLAHWPAGEGSDDVGADAGSRSSPPVPARWLRQLCSALQPQLCSCGAQALVLSLSALAFLGFHPGAAWLAAHEEALRCAAAAGQLSGKASARVAAGWARLRHRPTRKLLERLLKLLLAGAAAAPLPGELQGGRRREPLSARLFAQGLYGVAVLVAEIRGPGSGEPDLGDASDPWDGDSEAAPSPLLSPLLPAMHVRALLSASTARLPYGYLDEALLHLAAWRLLRVAPHPAWTSTLAAVARTKQRAAPPGVLLQLLRLLAWPGWRRFREQHLACAALRRGGRDAAPSLGAGPLRPEASRGLRVSATLVAAVSARLCEQLEELSGEQMVQLAAALAELRVPPGRAALRQLLQAVRSRWGPGAQDNAPSMLLVSESRRAGLEDAGMYVSRKALLERRTQSATIAGSGERQEKVVTSPGECEPCGTHPSARSQALGALAQLAAAAADAEVLREVHELQGGSVRSEQSEERTRSVLNGYSRQ